MTLKVTSATGPNGTVQGLAYDGFGRLVRSTVTPPGGTEGALASLRYDGFELFDIDGDGIPDAPSPGGRKITQKVFTNAVVPPENAGSAPGRITTTFFDKLGRTTGTDIQLGDTYQNQPLVVGRRTYDALGRIRFAADPYSPAFNSFPNTTYGTTYNYNTDGTPSCFVRGTGPKPASAAVSEARKYFRRAPYLIENLTPLPKRSVDSADRQACSGCTLARAAMAAPINLQSAYRQASGGRDLPAFVANLADHN